MKTQNQPLMPIRKCKSVYEEERDKNKLTNGKNTIVNSKYKHHEIQNTSPKPSNPCNYRSETYIKNLITSESSPINDLDSQLIPSPKTPKQPKEVLKKSIIKLKSSQWNEAASAMRDIVQISRFNPQLLEKSLPAIYRGTAALIKSLRPTVARTACQAANELFINMTPVQGPELEELIHTLLQKTGDINKSIKQDAYEALDSMVIHVPLKDSLGILLQKRVASSNITVRTTAAKLLVCVVNALDLDTEMPVNEETKNKLVLAGIQFLEDNSENIRLRGMQLLTILNQRKDFERIVKNKLNPPMLKKVNRVTENVGCSNRCNRYEMKNY